MTHPDSSPKQDISATRRRCHRSRGPAQTPGRSSFSPSSATWRRPSRHGRDAFVAEFAGGSVAHLGVLVPRPHRRQHRVGLDRHTREDVVRGNLCHHPAGVSQQFPGGQAARGLGHRELPGRAAGDARGGISATWRSSASGRCPPSHTSCSRFASSPPGGSRTRTVALRGEAAGERTALAGPDRGAAATRLDATPDGTCGYSSAERTEHTGVPETDLLGWRWPATLHPDVREPTRRLWTDRWRVAAPTTWNSASAAGTA